MNAARIRYDLDTRHRGISGHDYVVVLSPGVPAAENIGFRKRNLYLDASLVLSHQTFRQGRFLRVGPLRSLIVMSRPYSERV